MSTFKVPVVTIDEIRPHDNADRLECAVVAGWHVVVGKGQWKAGDLAVYLPIDSVLPVDLERKLFPEGSKITLSKSRIKSIKIRGVVSQGMVVKIDEVCPTGWHPADFKVGDDMSEVLDVTKYEPPHKQVQSQPGKRTGKRRKEHPLFKKYTDLENIKWYPKVFAEGEQVYVTEKVHGTNFRAGWVPTVANTWWKKCLKLLRMLPPYEFVYGSRNVQLQARRDRRGFYGKDIYGAIVDKYDLERKVPKGTVVYGEVYGDGIQPGYNYGMINGGHRLAVFDVYTFCSGEGQWLDSKSTLVYCDVNNLPHVPVLYHGSYNADLVKSLASGDSVLEPTQKVREGVVVKPEHEKVDVCGRKILKVINDDFLLGKHADQEVAHDQVEAA